MGIKEAIKILKRQSNILDIYKKKGKWFVHDSFGDTNIESDYDYYSDRELIAWARCFISDRPESWKAEMKKWSKRRNRAKTRDLIQTGDFDSIPQNKPCHAEDHWSWD